MLDSTKKRLFPALGRRCVQVLELLLLALLLTGTLSAGEEIIRLQEAGTGVVRFIVQIDSEDIEVTRRKGRDYIRIRTFADGGLPGAYTLPSRAVAVALPPGVQPKLSWAVLEEKAIPAPNPALQPVMDSFTGEVALPDFPWQEEPPPLLTILETGWQQENYLAVLQLQPARYSSQARAWKVATRIRVELRFDPSAEQKGVSRKPSATKLPQGIINPVQAVKWAGVSRAVPKVSAATERETPLARIIIREPGWYALTAEMLDSLGIDFSEIPPERLGITYRGKPVPVLMQDGNDGRFEAGDRIIFQGDVNRGSLTYLSPYTEVNVYLLVVFPGQAQRFGETDGGLYQPEAEVPDWYTAEKHFEQDHVFDRLLQQYVQDADHWFWFILTAGDDETLEFEIEGPVGVQDTARLSFSAMGLTYLPQYNPDHSIAIEINGTRVDARMWDGQRELTVRDIPIPAGLLREGRNTLRVLAPGDSRAREIDKFLFNWFSISWPREFVPVDEEIAFSPPKTGKPLTFRIKGFTTDELLLFDSFNRRIANYLLEQQDDRTWMLQFQDPAPRQDKRYFVLDSRSPAEPERIELMPEQPDFRSPDRGADYIIITHESFRQGLQPLIDMRTNQGMRVEVVELQQVFDQFSGGNYDPRAIRDLVRYAWENWQPPRPRYLLLVGDTHYYFRKGRYRSGNGEFMPTFLAYTVAWGLSASDNYFVQIVGDDILPDMAVGRFPVNNESELKAMVDKTVAYETEPDHSRWRGVVNLSSGDDPLFENQMDFLYQNYIPDAYRVTRVYTNEKSPYYGSTEELLAAFNEGALFMNFVGHGGGGVFTDDQLFLLDDAYLIRNRQRWSVLLTWSCFIGYFDNPATPSLGETLVRIPEYGTIANFGASGRAWLFGDRLFNGEFFNQIFRQDEKLRLGEIARRAKIDLLLKYGQRDLVLNYNIIGDPALHIPFPDETLELRSENSAVMPGGSIKVSGRAPGAQSGQVVVEAYHREDLFIDSVHVDNSAQGFSAEISLPDTIHGEAVIRAYFTDGTRHQIGALRFSADSLHFGEPKFQPETPRHEQPFYITVPITALQGVAIDSVFLFPGRSGQQGIRMREIQGGSTRSFRTEETVLTRERQTFYFRVAVHARFQGKPFYKESGLLYFRMGLRPDLRYAGSRFELRGSGASTQLVFPITNGGDYSSGAFAVTLNAAGGTSTPAGTDYFQIKQFSSLEPEDTLIVALDWPSPPAGWNRLKIQLDSEQQVDEAGEINNEYNLYLLVLTPEQGSGGWIFSSDSTVSFWVPPQAVDAVRAVRLTSWGTGRKARVDIPSTLEFLPLRSGRLGYMSLSGTSDTLAFQRDVVLRMLYQNNDKIDQALADGSLRVSWFDFASQKFSVLPFQLNRNEGSLSVVLPASGAFALARTIDSEGPDVRIRIDSQNFADGDYVSLAPEFTLSLADPSGIYLDPASLLMELDGLPVDAEKVDVLHQDDAATAAVLAYRPGELTAGSHTLTLQVQDRSGNLTRREIRFIVSDETVLRALANHPNPFVDETVIAYTLTGEADQVTLKIYSVAGRLVREWQFFNQTGYVEHIWDGRDELGEQVANGVYYLRFRARIGDRTIERIQKIARLQ